MTELQLKNRVRAAIRKKYPDAFIWKIHDAFTAGIPDFLVIIPTPSGRGKHIFIELKVGMNKLSRIQEWTRDKIKASGGAVLTCWSVQEVMTGIEFILGRIDAR
jgi:hypothetical protein